MSSNNQHTWRITVLDVKNIRKHEDGTYPDVFVSFWFGGPADSDSVGNERRAVTERVRANPHAEFGSEFKFVVANERQLSFDVWAADDNAQTYLIGSKTSVFDYAHYTEALQLENEGVEVEDENGNKTVLQVKVDPVEAAAPAPAPVQQAPKESVRLTGELQQVPHKPNTWRRKVIRTKIVPYTRKVAVPVSTEKVVQTTELKKIQYEKIVEKPTTEKVRQNFTKFKNVTKTKLVTIKVPKTRTEVKRRKFKVMKKRTVMKPVTRIQQRQEYRVISIPGSKVVEVPGYRIDEVEKQKIVEREYFYEYELRPVKTGEVIHGTERVKGVDESFEPIVHEGTEIFRKEDEFVSEGVVTDLRVQTVPRLALPTYVTTHTESAAYTLTPTAQSGKIISVEENVETFAGRATSTVTVDPSIANAPRAVVDVENRRVMHEGRTLYENVNVSSDGRAFVEGVLVDHNVSTSASDRVFAKDHYLTESRILAKEGTVDDEYRVLPSGDDTLVVKQGIFQGLSQEGSFN